MCQKDCYIYCTWSMQELHSDPNSVHVPAWKTPNKHTCNYCDLHSKSIFSIVCSEAGVRFYSSTSNPIHTNLQPKFTNQMPSFSLVIWSIATFGFITNYVMCEEQRSILSSLAIKRNCSATLVILSCILLNLQELGTDVNLYALVFGESVLNDAVSSAILYLFLPLNWIIFQS